MSHEDEAQKQFAALLDAARTEAPPSELGERVLDHIAYRARLEASVGTTRTSKQWALVGALLGLAAGIALLVLTRNPPRDAAITPEHPLNSDGPAALGSKSSSGSPSAATPAAPVFDPCTERAAAIGSEPLIDDFEDGDDSVKPLEGRVGFWRWAREIDAPGTAPALIPVPRSDATRANRLALHVKGGLLVDWGATVEFNFRPGCYDASKYVGVTFQARGPGRIYAAPREVDVIPIAEGGTCDHDCHNPHVEKIDLDAAWHTYQVRWTDVRQRGVDKPPFDPQRMNSLAFLIRPEDTPYDVWLDEVRFLKN
jgi:hypothetical protein